MTKTILTFFTNSGSPATGLSATIRIRDLASNSLVITDAAMTEVGDGFYSYEFTSYDEDTGYSIRCDGSATLTSNSDRYTYAGNESYVDDIWDAQIADHQVVGSMASEIRASHGTALGSVNEGRKMTIQEARALAKLVWETILEGEKTAGDILLSKSTFDSLKDSVVAREIPAVSPVNFDELMVPLNALVTKINVVNDNLLKLANAPENESPNEEPIEVVATIPESLSTDIAEVVMLLKDLKPSLETGFTNLTLPVTELTTTVNDLKTTLEADESAEAISDLSSLAVSLRDGVTQLLDLTEKIYNGSINREQLKEVLLIMNSIKYRGSFKK